MWFCHIAVVEVKKSKISQKDRNQFELLKYVEEKAFETNKNIECFFMERSKQFCSFILFKNDHMYNDVYINFYKKITNNDKYYWI